MSHSPPKGLAANLVFQEGSVAGSGEVEDDGHFTVGGSGSASGGWIPGDYTLRLSGQFVPSGDDMLLRSGIFDLNGRLPGGTSFTCNLSFSGIRQR
jgi:hypothetical protein